MGSGAAGAAGLYARGVKFGAEAGVGDCAEWFLSMFVDVKPGEGDAAATGAGLGTWPPAAAAA